MLTTSKEFVQQVLSEFSQDECPSMAAALAYATLFALPSLLLIIIFIAGLVLGPKAASGQIEANLSGTIGPMAAAQVQTMVSNLARDRAGGLIASLLGLMGLMVSATGVLLQLQQCLNKAWKVEVSGSGFRYVVMQRLHSALLVAGTGVLAMVSLAAGSAISALARMLPFPGATNVAEIAASLTMFVIIFAAILKVMPDVRLRWSDVWIGATFIATLFVAGKFLIAIYLAHTFRASAYGAAGSLAVILLWIYYSALIVLLGVELTQVWVRRNGREVVAKPGAVSRAPA
jgi:membrane protein